MSMFKNLESTNNHSLSLIASCYSRLSSGFDETYQELGYNDLASAIEDFTDQLPCAFFSGWKLKEVNDAVCTYLTFEGEEGEACALPSLKHKISLMEEMFVEHFKLQLLEPIQMLMIDLQGRECTAGGIVGPSQAERVGRFLLKRKIKQLGIKR